jgi:hypothetical protein
MDVLGPVVRIPRLLLVSLVGFFRHVPDENDTRLASFTVS